MIDLGVYVCSKKIFLLVQNWVLFFSLLENFNNIIMIIMSTLTSTSVLYKNMSILLEQECHYIPTTYVGPDGTDEGGAGGGGARGEGGGGGWGDNRPPLPHPPAPHAQPDGADEGGGEGEGGGGEGRGRHHQPHEPQQRARGQDTRLRGQVRELLCHCTFGNTQENLLTLHIYF